MGGPCGAPGSGGGGLPPVGSGSSSTQPASTACSWSGVGMRRTQRARQMQQATCRTSRLGGGAAAAWRRWSASTAGAASKWCPWQTFQRRWPTAWALRRRSRRTGRTSQGAAAGPAATAGAGAWTRTPCSCRPRSSRCALCWLPAGARKKNRTALPAVLWQAGGGHCTLRPCFGCSAKQLSSYLRTGPPQLLVDGGGQVIVLGEGAEAVVYLGRLQGARVAVKVHTMGVAHSILRVLAAGGTHSGSSAAPASPAQRHTSCRALPSPQVFELGDVQPSFVWRQALHLRQCRHPHIVPLLGVAIKVGRTPGDVWRTRHAAACRAFFEGLRSLTLNCRRRLVAAGPAGDAGDAVHGAGQPAARADEWLRPGAAALERRVRTRGGSWQGRPTDAVASLRWLPTLVFSVDGTRAHFTECPSWCCSKTTLPPAPFAPPMVARGRQVALDVCGALRYLHQERRMLHGDLKAA